jgi:hypothetical protein
MSTGDLPQDTFLCVPDHVLARKAGGETVLLNLDSETYYGLDTVGSSLWERLEVGTTFAQVVDALVAEYDVERSVLESDLRSLLADLVENRLVEMRAP